MRVGLEATEDVGFGMLGTVLGVVDDAIARGDTEI